MTLEQRTEKAAAIVKAWPSLEQTRGALYKLARQLNVTDEFARFALRSANLWPLAWRDVAELPIEVKNKVGELRTRGWTRPQIAAETRLTISQVDAILKAAGLTGPKSEGLSAAQKEQAVAARKNGATCGAIAASMGVTEGQVYYALQAQGLGTRINRKSSQRLSQKDKEALYELAEPLFRERKLTQAQIAEQLGVGRFFISEAARALGYSGGRVITRRDSMSELGHTVVPDAERASIQADHAGGMTVNAIAAKYGRCNVTVSKLLAMGYAHQVGKEEGKRITSPLPESGTAESKQEAGTPATEQISVRASTVPPAPSAAPTPSSVLWPVCTSGPYTLRHKRMPQLRVTATITCPVVGGTPGAMPSSYSLVEGKVLGWVGEVQLGTKISLPNVVYATAKADAEAVHLDGRYDLFSKCGDWELVQ